MGCRPNSERMPITILWFRTDLRLNDHPALTAAVTRGAVVPLFIWDKSASTAPDGPGPRSPGGAGKWWLHQSLTRLADGIAALGGRLILRQGDPLAVLRTVIAEVGADAVMWSRRYDASGIVQDTAIKTALTADGIDATSHAGHLVTEPWTVRTGAGGPYRVYTPFSKAVFAGHPPAPPVPAPTMLAPVSATLASDPLADWKLTPSKPDWSGGIAARWTPGEAGAQQRLDAFLDGPAGDYDHDRNFPDRPGVSYLSPHLRWGEISVRSVWHAAVSAAADQPGRDKGTHTFQKELLWRDFAYHLLYHFPTLPTVPLNQKFSTFPWRDDSDGLKAWQRGNTGIPIVDAGIRELWTTGYMHNRVRMIVGSFLVKHLLIPWQHGEAWFWDTLCDGDIASNTASWQWIAGCGADAAPFFRIFNPVTQGEKFDPNGTYLRINLPELARLPTEVIHQPWSAPPLVLAEAGVRLGETYPVPIIDLKQGRERALAAYQAMKELAA